WPRSTAAPPASASPPHPTAGPRPSSPSPTTPPPTSAPSPPMPDPAPQGDRPLRVLVVDDEPLARQRLLDLLARADGVEVAGTAASGREAVERIAALRPDVVFLDVQMPGLTGLDVVRAVGPEAMPVTVFATAYDRHALAAFDLAALDYLLKPFEDERFFQALARAREAVRLREVDRLRDRLLRLLQAEPAPPSVAEAPRYLERIAREMRGQVRRAPRGRGDVRDPGADAGAGGAARPRPLRPHPPLDHRPPRRGRGAADGARGRLRRAAEGRDAAARQPRPPRRPRRTPRPRPERVASSHAPSAARHVRPPRRTRPAVPQARLRRLRRAGGPRRHDGGRGGHAARLDDAPALPRPHRRDEPHPGAELDGDGDARRLRAGRRARAGGGGGVLHRAGRAADGAGGVVLRPLRVAPGRRAVPLRRQAGGAGGDPGGAVEAGAEGDQGV